MIEIVSAFENDVFLNFLLVLRAHGSSHLTEAVNSTGQNFTFCMCNPPFFGSLAERQELASYKPPKHASNPVAETDAVVEGGEIAFVTQMIEESLQLKDKIKLVLYLQSRVVNQSIYP